MKKILLLTTLLGASVLQTACDLGADTPAFGTGGAAASETGVPAVENFRVDLGDGFAMTIIDPDTGAYTPADNTLVISAFDSSGAPVDGITVNFAIEWGVFPEGTSCVTSGGTCSVAWSIATINTAPSDSCVRIVAYTTGEESFYDGNGNNTFDDFDTTSGLFNLPFVDGFIDVAEPYFDTNWDGIYTLGTDIPIPSFGSHDAGDGNYNGASSCTTTNFCSSTTSVTIWDTTYIDLKDETTATVPALTNDCV